MTATATNGRPTRKQLSDQLDRMDEIIDALATALPATVADACREGTRAAVRDALLEVLANPDLRALVGPQISVQSATSQPAPSESATDTPVRSEPVGGTRPGLLARAGAAVDSAAGRAKTVIAARCRAARESLEAAGRAAGEAVPFRRIALVALGVGLVVGVACLVLPQTTAALLGGIGAACTAVGVQVGGWLRNAARRIGLVS